MKVTIRTDLLTAKFYSLSDCGHFTIEELILRRKPDDMNDKGYYSSWLRVAPGTTGSEDILQFYNSYLKTLAKCRQVALPGII